MTCLISLLCLHEEAIGAWISLRVLSEDSDQIGQKPRLISVFSGCTGDFVGFIMFVSFVLCFKVRDEYRTDFDEGRGGYGKIVAQKIRTPRD